MMNLFLFCFCLCQITLATAGAVCATGCQTAVSNNEFSGISLIDDYYSALCQNVLQVQSTFICMRSYCSEDEITEGLRSLGQSCEVDGGVELLPWSIIDNVTEAQVESWPFITYEDTQTGVSFDTSAFVDQDLFDIAFQTMFDWEHQIVTRKHYGYATIGFWGLVVLFGTLNNILQHLINSSVLRSKFIRRCQGSITRYLVVPPILKSTRITRIFGIPTTSRLHVITISIFFLINIILMCVEYHAFENNLYFTRKSTQLWRYVADRAGVMTINNLPVMWIFATRNNFLLWATGWDFTTFNIFHRWIARACGLEIFVHGVTVCLYQYLESGNEYFLPLWKDTDWFMAVIAALSIILSCLLASSGIRKTAYDMFLIIHQGFACLILVGLWYHLTVDGPDYVVFIWPCVAVWSFDRLGRISRLLTLTKLTSYSSAEYNREANIILLKTRVRQHSTPKPGTYYYVYGWRSLKFWESHPFTLSGWNTVNTEEESFTELIFLVGIRSGFTSRLQRQLMRHEGSEMDVSSAARKISLAVEGPYGPNFCPWNSEMAIFIIGGAGITVATSFMQQLLDSVRGVHHLDQKAKSIRIVWAIKNPMLYRFVHEHYISIWEDVFASTDIELSLDVYLTCSPKINSEVAMSTEHEPQLLATSEDKQAAVSPSSSTKFHKSAEKVVSGASSQSSGPGPLRTTFCYGRPSISDIITSQVESLHSSGGKKLALIGCGPKAMAHDIRLAFAEVSERPHVTIDFHLAPFGW